MKFMDTVKDFYTKNKMYVNIVGGLVVAVLAWKMFKK